MTWFSQHKTIEATNRVKSELDTNDETETDYFEKLGKDQC